MKAVLNNYARPLSIFYILLQTCYCFNYLLKKKSFLTTPNIENKFLSSNIPAELLKGRIVPVNFQIHFLKLW